MIKQIAHRDNKNHHFQNFDDSDDFLTLFLIKTMTYIKTNNIKKNDKKVNIIHLLEHYFSNQYNINYELSSQHTPDPLMPYSLFLVCLITLPLDKFKSIINEDKIQTLQALIFVDSIKLLLKNEKMNDINMLLEKIYWVIEHIYDYNALFLIKSLLSAESNQKMINFEDKDLFLAMIIKKIEHYC